MTIKSITEYQRIRSFNSDDILHVAVTKNDTWFADGVDQCILEELRKQTKPKRRYLLIGKL